MVFWEMHDATLTGCVTLSHAQKSLTKPQKIKHLNAPELSFESYAKGCEYLFTCAFFLYICKDLNQTCFTLSLWGIVCGMLRKIINIRPFGISLLILILIVYLQVHCKCCNYL